MGAHLFLSFLVLYLHRTYIVHTSMEVHTDPGILAQGGPKMRLISSGLILKSHLEVSYEIQLFLCLICCIDLWDVAEIACNLCNVAAISAMSQRLHVITATL